MQRDTLPWTVPAWLKDLSHTDVFLVFNTGSLMNSRGYPLREERLCVARMLSERANKLLQE